MSRVFRAAAVVLAAALSLGAFFRVHLFTWFGQTWGSQFDGGIEAAILEHWYNVLRGMEPWNRTAWFFPAPDTLGYNDGYFLYGVAHALFRSAGADIFVASALVDMLVKAVGFGGAFLCLRRVFACRFGWALLGAVLFTVAHGPFRHALHQQLLSVSFAPVLALLAWEAWGALRAERPGRFVLWGAAAALFWGAWLFTAYYMAWFATLFGCVLAVLAVPAGLRSAWDLAWRRRWHCAAVAAVAVVAVLPFLMVYLPKLGETGGQSWREILFYTPRPNDIVNLGPDSTMWGRFAGVLCPLCTRNSFELSDGITPVLLWLFAAGVLWLVLRGQGGGGRDRTLPRLVGLATVVLFLLLFRWSGSLSGWWLVWKLVPGAGGVRVVSRLELFLVAPVVAVTVVYLQHLSGRVPRHLLLLLAALLLAEQAEPGMPMYTRRTELARLEVPPAPPACRVFYVSATDGSANDGELWRIYPHNVEAMLLSELLHLPTINGHSTFDPPGWNFADPLRPDYEDRVRAYAAAHGVSGLCRLDLLARRWDGPV